MDKKRIIAKALLVIGWIASALSVFFVYAVLSVPLFGSTRTFSDRLSESWPLLIPVVLPFVLQIVATVLYRRSYFVASSAAAILWLIFFARFLST